MTTLAEHMIVDGAENRPSMLEKSMYNSWQSRMMLYIKGKENARMILNSVLNGPLVCGTIKVNGVTRTKTYEELTEQEKLQDDCDIRATNIVLQGLPPDVYSLVNHHNVYLKKGESLYEYYLRFAQLINDMHTIRMKMQPVQVNTKFLNSLQPEWSKFVTDVKLVKNMHTSDYGQLYAYLSQHEAHANEVRLMRERFPDPLALTQISSSPSVPQHAYQAPTISQQPQAEFLQLDAGLAVPSFLPGDDPFAKTKLPFRMVGLQFNKFRGDKVRVLLVLDGEQLAFLADPRVAEGQDTQITMPHNAAVQTDDLDSFDSYCDKAPGAKAVLMANLSSYDSNVISEVPISETNQDNSILDNCVQEMYYSEQPTFDPASDIEIIIKTEVRSKLPVGSWGFEHTKDVFLTEVIPFMNSLRESFKDFDNGLHLKLNEVKTVFNQMEAVVEQCSVYKKCFEIQKKELLLENDRLLELIISQDLVHTAVNTLAAITDYESMRMSYTKEYNRNLTLKAELSKMNKLSKTCSRLQKHCISLELKLQQNKESFQNNRSCNNLDAPAFKELFVINDLKAQLQAKESSISKLRAYIATLKGKDVSDNSVPVNSAIVIAPGMFRSDLEPLYSKLKNKMEAHEDYL
ncbi:hypothetical protein Tco_0596582 [Tanacetum coccineum]